MKKSISKCITFLSAFFLMVMLFSCLNTETKDTFDESEIKTNKPLPDGHKQFILDFYPKIVEANKKVLSVHNKIKDLKSSYQKVSGNKAELIWLNKVAGKYKFDQDMFKPNLSKDEFERLIDTLLFRVDIIPGKMVMAQAIAESGWGQSNFA
nr:hypothetical protein [Bacteroidota bacterium]